MNTLKKKYLEQLAAYFISKSKILTSKEYKAETDVPIRPVLIKRKLGNWARIIRLVKANFPEVCEVLEAPIKKEVKVVAPVKVIPKLKEGEKDVKTK